MKAREEVKHLLLENYYSDDQDSLGLQKCLYLGNLNSKEIGGMQEIMLKHSYQYAATR